MTALLSLLLTASPAAPLNTEGFRLYQAKQYPEALEKFRAAVAADETHALSHYNLAATLALLRGQGKVCEFDAYQGAVLDHLERAVQLDARRRKRMQQDKDFDSVRDTLRYQRLLGRKPAVEKDAAALFVALAWYAPAVGAFGNAAELHLKSDGTFTLGRLLMENDELRRDVTAGRFRVKGFQVTFDFAKPVDGKKQRVGRLTPEGHLVVDGLGELTDLRSECDA